MAGRPRVLVARVTAALAAATLALVLGLVLAGCGGSGSPAAKKPPVSRHARDLARLAADVAALRAGASKVHGNTLMGTPQLQRETARYLHDLNTSSLDDLTRNRQIDFAAAAVSGVCGQCFQQLEADRPIPALDG